MEHQALISSPRRGGASRASLGLALLAFIGSCAPVGKRPEPLEPPPSTRGAPDWAGMASGWQKLTEIERWLRTDADRHDPFWRPQGELLLAEGRLALAQSDAAAAKIDAPRLAERLQLARSGFERVLADPAANAAQKARAERGRMQVAELAPSPAGPALALAVVPRSAWRARSLIPSRLDPVGGSWLRITVHHSDQVPGTRLDGTLADSQEALRKIQHNAIENERWGDIGYHFLIDASGRIFEGRPLEWQGAHARGDNNVRNLGICLLGDFHRRPPSPAALAALEALLEELRAKNGLARSSVVCHRDLVNTVCPGDALASWVKSYRRGAPPELFALATEGAAPKASPAPPRGAAVPASAKRKSGGAVR